MTTLRDLWVKAGLTSTELASKARISPPTLYRMNRKEHVYPKNLNDVLRILGITRAEYDALDPCPQADQYK